jgi:hypothetical protein
MEDFCHLIESLGGLHDAEVVSLVWMPAQAEIRMSVEDINANFDGLPEYGGPTPAAFVFSGVTDVEWAVDRPDPRLKIYDWDIVPIAGGYRSEVRISPSGKLVIQCADIERAPSEP